MPELESILRLASQITHPVTVVAFSLGLAAYAFGQASRAKKPRIAFILAVGIIVLGFGPLAASTYLASRGVYHVRVIVLGADRSPIGDADVSSSIGGEPKRIQGGWEYDIPPQTRPTDGRVVLFASEKNAFLSGTSALVLTRDYFPTTTIQLIRDTSAMLRGVVVDEHRRSIVGASVSISGYSDIAVTDKMGNFVLPAHASDGQIVEVRAQKDQSVGSMSVPAGDAAVELVVKRP